jgi:hypothetical protein
MPVKRETKTTKRAKPPDTMEAERLPLEPEETPTEAEGFEEVVDRVRAKETSPARRAVQERQQKEVLEVSAATTVEVVIRSIAELRLGVNGALDTLSTALVEQAKRLAQLEEAERLRRM